MQFINKFVLVKYAVFCNIFLCDLTYALYGRAVRDTNFNDVRFVVGIAFRTDAFDPIQNYICAGTLLSIVDVITSEHCVYQSNEEGIAVLIGSNKLTEAEIFYPAWWLGFDSWCAENEKPIDEEDNDIVILRLTREVHNVNASIAPISYLPIKSFFRKMVNILGWGVTSIGNSTDILQTARIRVITNRECGNRVTIAGRERMKFDSRYLCTYIEPSILIQKGDSGAPLVYNNEVIAINVGTCPFANIVVHPDKVNVHHSMAYYEEFIKHIRDSYLD